MRYKFVICFTVLALSLGACQPTAAPTKITHETPFKSNHFTVTTQGSGPHIILVPGLASNGAIWDGTVAALGDDYTTHVIQVSGFGGAPTRGNEGNTNILDDLSLDLTAYAHRLTGDVAMVGHSLGGLITMKAALQDDSPLDAIIIVDVLPFFSVLMDKDATANSIAPISAMMKAVMIAQSEDVFAASQSDALKALVKAEDDRALALSWSLASDRQVMAQAMSEVLVTDLRSDIGALTIPATILYARDPAIVNMADIEVFYQTLYAPINVLELNPVDGALHFIMLDQPDTFHALLKNALSK
jgi:pimeloyl-ACP methyl ester carboxylesterase